MPSEFSGTWEIGSNKATAITIAGMDAFKDKLKSLHAGLQGAILREALYKAAEIFAQAIRQATPVGRSEYTYSYPGRKKPLVVPSWHSPGQAAGSVIVFEPQGKGYATTSEEMRLHIGYEKRSGFYMWWSEFGSSKEAARPYFRAAVDAAEPAALAAAEAVISGAVEGVATGTFGSGA
jgi:HK97 gp10 family phage protein